MSNLQIDLEFMGTQSGNDSVLGMNRLTDLTLSPICLCLTAGARGNDEIYQPGKPGCVPPPDRRPAGHRHVLHRLVFCVSFPTCATQPSFCGLNRVVHCCSAQWSWKMGMICQDIVLLQTP